VAVRSRSWLKHFRVWLNAQIAGLYPGSFALVMATGIISDAMLFEGHRLWSHALFAVNLVAYPLLLLLTAWRGARFWPALRGDLTNPRLVFGFFTIVAATAVLGTGLSLRGFVAIAAMLWFAAFLLWLALIYFGFGVLIFAKAERSAKVVHGGWLNAIVGTESLVLLGVAAAPAFDGSAAMMFVVLHWLWGIGLALYAIFIVLFAYHLFFFDVEPEDLSPLLWVVMGAAAIATNAGSELIRTESGMPFLTSMRPFIDGVTLLLWAWATWWIPLLVMLGVWKHVVCRLPLTYTPQLWSLVFPLGMYAVATLHLSLAADFPPLRVLSAAMVWIAFAAWIVAAIGLGKTIMRGLSGSAPAGSS
jgi:tellurite resistance protein TehA-like permease